MTTTELINLLKRVEFGGVTGLPRRISFEVNGKFMPNPRFGIDATGDGIAGAELCLGVAGEMWDYEEDTSKNLAEEYDDCDQFICSKCGIELHGWTRVERDEDTGEETHHEYVLRFCPNCGLKIKNAR